MHWKHKAVFCYTGGRILHNTLCFAAPKLEAVQINHTFCEARVATLDGHSVSVFISHSCQGLASTCNKGGIGPLKSSYSVLISKAKSCSLSPGGGINQTEKCLF